MPKSVPNLLLVEGKDDLYVISNLCEIAGLPDTFSVRDMGGYDAAMKRLDVELDASDLQVLGIVVDADADLAGRWQAICDRLRSKGWYSTIPSLPDPAGTVIRAPTHPTVGIWLMPDNQLAGMLEDFVAWLIPPGDVLWPHAQRCVTSVAEIKSAPGRFKQVHISKARIHTWLAWQDEPGRPLGQAITMRMLQPQGPQAQAFLTWLHILFSLPPPPLVRF